MNPFEELCSNDTTPADPDMRFAARLRRHVNAALAPEITLPQRKTDTMTTSTITTATETAATTTAAAAASQTPQLITPYLAVDDAAGALEWYAEALGAAELMRYTGDDGRIGHAEIEVHGAHLYLSDAYPEIGVVAASTQEGSSVALHLDVHDVDQVHARAIDAGATSQRDPSDQTHGSRTASIIDPYGHRWMLSTRIATPTIDEIDAASPGFDVAGSPAEGSPAEGSPEKGPEKGPPPSPSSSGTTRSAPTTSSERRRSIPPSSAGTSIP
jgi:uncharacterized glyoxalase superfamily protein PhnB